jgi:hypothetical protein
MVELFSDQNSETHTASQKRNIGNIKKASRATARNAALPFVACANSPTSQTAAIIATH